MNIIELVLFFIGLAMFPYGAYEIWKGSGDRDIKLLLIGLSIALYVIETVLAFW